MRALALAQALLLLTTGLAEARRSPPASPGLVRRAGAVRQAGRTALQKVNACLVRVGVKACRPAEKDAVRDLSTASLLVAGAHEVARLSSRLGPAVGIGSLGIGSVGLGAHSLHKLARAKDTEGRADAAHGLAWSLQGLTGLSRWLGRSSPGIQTAGTLAGVAGGALQAGVGAHRLVTGVRGGDRRRALLGALDIGAGLCWTASACGVGLPYSLAGFIGLSGVRLVLDNQDGLRHAAARLVSRLPRPRRAPR